MYQPENPDPLAVASVGLHRFDEAANYADLVLVDRLHHRYDQTPN